MSFPPNEYGNVTRQMFRTWREHSFGYDSKFDGIVRPASLGLLSQCPMTRNYEVRFSPRYGSVRHSTTRLRKPIPSLQTMRRRTMVNGQKRDSRALARSYSSGCDSKFNGTAGPPRAVFLPEIRRREVLRSILAMARVIRLSTTRLHKPAVPSGLPTPASNCRSDKTGATSTQCDLTFQVTRSTT